MPKPYVAINMADLRNEPKTFEMFASVGPKVCMVTARHPGFVGFQNHIQIGVLPFGTRYGGAKMDMTKESSTVRVLQYTFWKDWKDHEEMHRQNWSYLFRLCFSCASQMIWGPWEPLYEITYANMPINTEMTDFTEVVGRKFAEGKPMEIPAISQPYGKRVVAYAEHTVKPGKEKQFEDAIIKTLEMFKRAPGFLGAMVLKEIGVSAIGSFQFGSKGLHELLETPGSLEPDPNSTIFEPPEAKPTPPNYIVHVEWADQDALQFGMGRVLLSPEYRAIHDQALDTLIYGPYIRIINPIMEGTFWREYLNG
ncbi:MULTISPECIES: sulfur oxygenase reductase family protein [Acidianus]|uniref:Sulfur oxidation protein n=1 Tax=Candidatus Acidianus copahuensis TaxID=1160895 RepID=A0A031LS77_9CREN|nr:MULTISPECIES: sulfur oxygenase reductase family protein [Acidianus]EZQ10575.1 sulfur oxidation protein [Candidatus Acidianus copahuensis]NON62818.1 sulfur oxidation protein [Acidianus sp. RZ1]